MKSFYHRAWAEIHLDRLKYNYDICKSFLNANTEIMAAVKANAYGHGDKAVTLYLESLGVNWFAVSNIAEAIHLRSYGITKEILILGYVPCEYIDDLIKYNITQAVTSVEYAKELDSLCTSGSKLKVHIKYDTGMGRIGLKSDNINDYILQTEEILGLNNLYVEGIFTHLSVADSDNEDNIAYTTKQYQLLIEIRDALKKRGHSIPLTHYANSAAAAYHNTEQSDLARYGIMLYGLYPNHSLKLPQPLKPVMDLKAVVSHVKTIQKDDCVSYGRTYIAHKDIKVATLTIGYADGYSRLLSSKAEVLINNQKAKIIGKVCMDQMMIDVTDLDVKPGDIVTLFGDCEITADDLADLYGTIGYEIVCGISKRVPRVIINNGEILEIIDN